MFCGECGTKNEVSANFCEECGAKLKNNKKASKMSNMSKQNKMMLGIITGVLAIIIIIFIVLGNMFKPENIAKNFFKATIDGNTDKMYNYLNIEENRFTSKKMFEKVFKKELLEDTSDVLNYKVTNVKKSIDGLSVDVTISYTQKDKSLPKTTNITLKKSKNNKLIFFSNWVISSEQFVSDKSIKINVVHDSELTIEGFKINKKYLNKKESDEDEDVYELPKMLIGEYNIKIKLPVGFVVEDKLNINKYYNEYDIKIDSNNIPEKTQNKIKKTIKSNLKTMYDAAINKKSFDEIKSNFDYKTADLTEIKEDYETLVSNLTNSSTTLTSIDFTDAEIINLSFDDNEIKIRTKIKYKYEVKYKNYNDEEKTNKSSDYDYLTISFDCVDGNYKMIDTTTLTTYFSKYN